MRRWPACDGLPKSSVPAFGSESSEPSQYGSGRSYALQFAAQLTPPEEGSQNSQLGEGKKLDVQKKEENDRQKEAVGKASTFSEVSRLLSGIGRVQPGPAEAAVDAGAVARQRGPGRTWGRAGRRFFGELTWFRA